jgi:hypothetical protein
LYPPSPKTMGDYEIIKLCLSVRVYMSETTSYLEIVSTNIVK